MIDQTLTSGVPQSSSFARKKVAYPDDNNKNIEQIISWVPFIVLNTAVQSTESKKVAYPYEET